MTPARRRTDQQPRPIPGGGFWIIEATPEGATMQHTDSAGRTRRPEQDEALERINADRSPAPGHVSTRLRCHIPEDLADAWANMTAQERGAIITAGFSAGRRYGKTAALASGKGARR